MIHEIVVSKADSGVTVEFFPTRLEDKVLMLLDFERLPTHKKYLTAALASENTTTSLWNTNGGKQY